MHVHAHTHISVVVSISHPSLDQTLTVWAYPQKSHHFKDAIVCCVRHNPNPVILPISCQGVEPDLKVDKKMLEFKKVLLHRLVLDAP